ncbi:putative GPI-anchored protein 58 [Hordeum vulgare]|nr:putative GPI-anchored protein 58 [Hordeum vulgare]
MSAMAATGAALRLRLLFRMLRVGELIALAALLSWSSSRAPSAAAAALRVAGSLLFSPRFVFVLGNAIVLLLLALSRRERGDHPAPATSSGAGIDQSSQAPAVLAAGSFASFASPTTPTPTPTQASEAPVAMAMATVPEEEEEVVKPVVSVTTHAASKARAPRRTRSEKMGRRGELSRRSASPEPVPLMRRSESDNGRRRRSSVTARDVGVARGWAGTDDAEEFRRTVEAFIAKQTRFRREEESMAGTLVVVDILAGKLLSCVRLSHCLYVSSLAAGWCRHPVGVGRPPHPPRGTTYVQRSFTYGSRDASTVCIFNTADAV